MTKHLDQRVGVFVDTQNMYWSAKNLYKANVNFKEILKTAVAGRKLIRAIAYVIKSESRDEVGFFDALDKQGFEVASKDLQIFFSGVKKGDWDVGIAVDAIKMADKLDAVVLVCGDGDFIPMVKYLQENKGCFVEVLAFGKTTSSKLIEAADDFINMDDNPGKYLIRTRTFIKK
ncbi:NYN domain-containing protein [Candidatus Falkowbacteria bacterium]|nr:NYN domain-containing protein [Candidatus Falkowbacteria bacterium]